MLLTVMVGAAVDSEALLIGSDTCLILEIEGKAATSGFSSKAMVNVNVLQFCQLQSASNTYVKSRILRL